MYADSNVWAVDERWLQRIGEAIARRRAGDTLSDLRAASMRVTSIDRLSGARNIAILPVVGLIEKRTTWLGELFGSCSTQKLTADLHTAMADRTIEGVVLLVDSGGGAVDGTEEAAAAIRAARDRKPIVAVVDGLAASAAYWLAAQADHLTVTPSGEVGSVGVYSTHLSVSRALKNDGLDVNVIQSTPAKAELHPALSLSDDARTAMQARVDFAYHRFLRDVATGRGTSEAHVRASYGQGRTLSSPDARRAGMVDAIAAPPEAVQLAASYIERVAGVRERRAYAYQWVLSADDVFEAAAVLARDEPKVPFLMTPDEYDGHAELARHRIALWAMEDREAW